MDLALSLPSSISQPQDQYRTPGYRPLILKLIRFESPHCPLAGQTIRLALHGLNRCLIAVPRQRLDLPINCSSWMAMDLTLQWILSSTVIRTRSSLLYPPHSTHTLQPLDVVMFKPLATGYSNKVAGFMERSQGLTSMSKRDFFPLFYQAWEASFKEMTIPKAFEATGLSPFNPDVILKRFNTTSSSSSDSESSALSASNWRKTERLLREVVKDRGDKRAQKLSQAFHQISTQNTLLEHEVKGLRKALVSERKRRKRGKALLLEEPEEYHGGAVFWSPRKVKEAHEQQQLKEHEEEQLQHQKAEASRHREEARQAKAKAIQARRQAKDEARVSREKKKADQAAKQASRAAACRTHQQLKQALKTSYKSKKRGLKAPVKATFKKKSCCKAYRRWRASRCCCKRTSSQVTT
jgi:hypothetical protein